ncbi:DNA cytosine methyltransferase [Enterococcus hulanensis]|uniref:DNA cytosine methyltransferase n=1 Tax=Enterococcus hulanensis TaxID=2559929 RepID=UPI0028904701|nr:DNA cytosine methyltransferase [Enterococcus hulanensis]MDT2661146.1 DNA cytosine methyltransferase [Enterococcus hulanensis]
MTFLDLFAGIGGFRFGMEQAGHQCIGFCEIDRFARKSYKAIHDTRGEVELHDITAVTDDALQRMRRPDVLTGGFPCQTFSLSGKRRGFGDTRGTLFFEIARFASILRPRILFLENVRGILNHDQGNTFEAILRVLDGLGYDVEWQVLNSKDYLPQNRERVFLIGHFRETSFKQVFPFQREGQEVSSIEQARPRHSRRSERGLIVAGKFEGKFAQSNRVFSVEGYAPTLMTGESGPMIYVKGSKTEHSQIRRLTALECWRLQGFPDWAYEKAAQVNSEYQLYRQAGNSVTVPVIYDIARRLN